MSDGAVPKVARSLTVLTPPLRRRVALGFAAAILVTYAAAALLLLTKGLHERQHIRSDTLSTAIALSFGFDQEVAAGNALLQGLSSSPALKSGDATGFYDQLKATPIPDGSWLMLSDLEGQVANTLWPFGTSLPRHQDFPTYPEALNRVREHGRTTSGRMESPVKPGTAIVALDLRIDHDDGSMKGHITTVLSQDRLQTILGGQDNPEGWMRGLYDRTNQPIATARRAETLSRIPLQSALAARLAAASESEVVDGFIEDSDESGIPVLVAYRRSGVTDWTTVVAVPLAYVNAPVTGVLTQMAGMAALLLMAGGASALFTAHKVDRPLRWLSDQVASANWQVRVLSGQLLVLQEEERQYIARELHDSTAQRLVAASLGLSRLEARVREDPVGSKVLTDVEDLLSEALRELRIFTYLLHPPNLAQDGLQATLRDFAEGFAGRTGLVARIRIPEEVDDLPQDFQRAILRVVQEALTNVHRHADATHVSVKMRVISGRRVVCIRDNGHGMVGWGEPEGSIRFGVGIGGMRARLEQFGGALRIRTGRSGTSVIAMVPVHEAGRRPRRAGRLLTQPARYASRGAHS